MSSHEPEPAGRRLLPGVPAAHHGRGERILHVDDEPTVTLALHRLLAKLGYHVDVFNDPRTATTRLQAAPESYDLVLTDLMMPGMSGLEVARAVQVLRPNLPVVLLSAFTEGHSREDLTASGIREIIVKPASIGLIAASIRRVLDQSRPSA